uniref:Uncharacterized protein n=1 Tax=Arundo donax TaxID=35708 RepID=A0A0A9BX70_ARUDO
MDGSDSSGATQHVNKSRTRTD